MLSEIVEDGFLARANHSVLGVVDNETQDSVRRYERMVDFLQELYTWLPTLDGEDVLARCRAVLRQEPILNGNTRCSFIIDIPGEEPEEIYKTVRLSQNIRGLEKTMDFRIYK